MFALVTIAVCSLSKPCSLRIQRHPARTLFQSIQSHRNRKQVNQLQLERQSIHQSPETQILTPRTRRDQTERAPWIKEINSRNQSRGFTQSPHRR